MCRCTIVLFSVMYKDLLHFLNWNNPPRQCRLVGWLYIIFTITTTDDLLLCCETITLHCELRFLSSIAFSMFRVIWSPSQRSKWANYVNVSEPWMTWSAHAGKLPFAHTEHWALDIYQFFGNKLLCIVQCNLSMHVLQGK